MKVVLIPESYSLKDMEFFRDVVLGQRRKQTEHDSRPGLQKNKDIFTVFLTNLNLSINLLHIYKPNTFLDEYVNNECQ